MFNTTTTAEKVPISTTVRFNQIQVNFSDTHDSCKKRIYLTFVQRRHFKSTTRCSTTYTKLNLRTCWRTFLQFHFTTS